MKYFNVLPLYLLAALPLVGCGNQSDRQNLNDSEEQSSSTRYVCTPDVLMRNDALAPTDAPLLEASQSVKLIGGSKTGTGSLGGHRFTKVKTKSGDTGWVSTSFLKTAPCGEGSSSRRGSGSISGSVLHFTGDKPGVLAMLDAIAYSEFRNNPEATTARAYNLLFGYKYFSSFARHPDTVVCTDICSAAAGRYQIMPDTWSEAQNYIANNKISEIPWMTGRLPDFSPASQDKMAIYKIWYRFAYAQLRRLSYNDNVNLRSVTDKLALEWASLPGNVYGQGGVNWEEFKKYYWSRFSFYSK